MVFLGLEKPVEYGAQQIFDPTMANMVLLALQQYNEAARKEYERGLEDFDKFTTKYGDFISPFAKDMARYGEMVGGILNVVDLAYKDGVDLLRSPEGRMLVHRLTNSIDPKEFNMMRANAKLGYAYLDALKDLAAKGKSSKELEDYIASLPGNVAFDQFSTKENGTWNRMPTEYSTLQQFVHPSFANLKPHLLTKQEAMSRVGAEYDPRADYRGITKADMEASMRDALPGLTGNALYGFYRDLAKKQLIAAGITNPTEEQINEQFVQNAVTADHQMMMPLDKDYERYYKDQNLRLQQSSHQLARDKFNWDKVIDLLQLGYDPDGNPISTSSSSGGGYGLNNKTLGAGAADQLAVTQDKQRAEYTDKIKLEIISAEGRIKSAYDKMSPGFKVIADKYKKYTAILSDPTTPKDKIKEATEFIGRWQNNSNKEFQNWKQLYDSNLTDSYTLYYNLLTGNTKFGKELHELITMSNAHDIFKNANIVGNLTTKQKEDLNTALNLVETDNGLVGTVTSDTEYSPITEARFTGNRVYRYNSIISKINRLIQNKKYTVSDEDISGRHYASGATRNNVRYDIIQQIGTFKGDDLKTLLKDMSDEELKQYGIEKVSDNEYKIPISTRFSQGNQSWGDVNTSTHKRNKLVSEEAAIEQAKSLIRKYGK